MNLRLNFSPNRIIKISPFPYTRTLPTRAKSWISCTKPCVSTRKKKLSRIFYIQKVNRRLKNQILANFAFVEQTVKGESFVYPFGWDTEKIEVKDINENCISIIERKIKPL
jgi:hypothetical protein